MHGRRIGKQPAGLAQSLNGLIECAHFTESDPKIELRLGVVGPEVDGHSKFSNCRTVVALVAKLDALMVVPPRSRALAMQVLLRRKGQMICRRRPVVPFHARSTFALREMRMRPWINN